MTEEERMRSDLLEMITSDAIQFGDFIFASGQRSKNKVFMDRVLATRKGLRLVGILSALVILECQWQADSIGGPETGAIAMSSAILSCRMQDRIKRGFHISKEGEVSGALHHSDKVLLVDDVATTGGSLLHCVEVLRRFDHQVVGALVVVDRQSGATEALREEGIELAKIFSLEEVSG